MHCADFSSFRKLLRVTAYVQRTVDSFKAKGNSDSNLRIPITLTPQEIANAERLWITNAQRELVLQKDFAPLRHQFGLFLDDKALWRCGGRLQNADLPFPAKHPVLLPKNHPVTTLIVHDAHCRVSHNGVKDEGTGLCEVEVSVEPLYTDV